VAGTGEEALKHLEQSARGNPENPQPDIILLDLNMPGMGGTSSSDNLRYRSGYFRKLQITGGRVYKEACKFRTISGGYARP